MWKPTFEPSTDTPKEPGLYLARDRTIAGDDPSVVEVFQPSYAKNHPKPLMVFILGHEVEEPLDNFEFFGKLTVVKEREEVPYEKRPVAIWHEGDAAAFYAATKEEQAAWNEYANSEARKFSENLATYETIHGCIGTDRDGNITNWCPPLFFPEWLEKRKQGQ